MQCMWVVVVWMLESLAAPLACITNWFRQKFKCLLFNKAHLHFKKRTHICFIRCAPPGKLLGAFKDFLHLNYQLFCGSLVIKCTSAKCKICFGCNAWLGGTREYLPKTLLSLGLFFCKAIGKKVPYSS